MTFPWHSWSYFLHVCIWYNLNCVLAISWISEKSKGNYSLDIKKEASKDGGSEHIPAHTFTFRELATATKNFRADCLLGEGGFGRVYKGHLESTNQVSRVSLIEFLTNIVNVSEINYEL